MNAPKDETWRLRYLRILTSSAKDLATSQEDLQAIEDLVDERLMRGSTVPDAQGVVRGAALVEGSDGLTVPTLKGRLFIEDQRAFLQSKTFLGRLKTNWPLFSGILGIIVGWGLGLLTPVMQQRTDFHRGPAPANDLTQSAGRQQTALLPSSPVASSPAKP